jgi:hypothetical protein
VFTRPFRELGPDALQTCGGSERTAVEQLTHEIVMLEAMARGFFWHAEAVVNAADSKR